jgi:hypothetical protein
MNTKMPPVSWSRKTLLGLGCAVFSPALLMSQPPGNAGEPALPLLKNGERQLFVDDLMVRQKRGLKTVTHPARKLDRPVLAPEMPWENRTKSGTDDKRVNIYGTVLRDEETGTFRMWYAHTNNVLYATSKDGIHWERPTLNIVGKTNLTNLKLHSPSIILDKFETDPNKRYKAVGCVSQGVDAPKLQRLKDKFELVDWYRDVNHRLYYKAYSADGLRWTVDPEPILLGCDTITLSQDPKTGEYLAFHKRQGDPRVVGIRQVFLSVSKDMENWSEPQPVMVTDEIDHKAARRLEGGTHAEFYNMSAFPYQGQWFGFVTPFLRVETPNSLEHNDVEDEKKGAHKGPVDVQLTHSRDGRHWHRARDRSPAIPLGPHPYDSGSIFGLCNAPVIVGDEIWMYYTAVTTPHGGKPPEREMSIARAAWRIDGLASLQAGNQPGLVETHAFRPEGKKLFVNADVKGGRLMVEVLDANGKVIEGYEKETSLLEKQDSTRMAVTWNGRTELPNQTPIRLKFHLENGDLYSYVVE